MLCFRCGSPVEQEATECANCGQIFDGDGAPEGGEVAALKEQLRRGGRTEGQASLYRSGELISERYEVVDVIGGGPLGTVYKAHDTEIDVDVAVKVMAGEYLPDEGSRGAFLARIGQLRRVVHNNVVRYFEVGADGERCFYVTQFLEGLSLRKIMDLRREKGQRFSLREVEPIVTQVAEALGAAEFCHAGVKPENVIILPNLLKVTDLALAEALPRDSYLAAQRSLGGAEHFLAPEIKAGGPITPASDVYALGVLVVELLTGERYAGGEVTVSELDEEFPAELDSILAQAVAEKEEDRFANVEAFASALAPLSEGADGKSVGEGRAKGARKTLPFGSAVAEEGTARPDATLRYGQVRAEDERPTVKVVDARPEQQDEGEAAEDGEASSASGPSPEAQKEVTQMLDLEDVEVEEESLEGEGEPPVEGTQQLSLEDVEFASGSMAVSPEEAKERRHHEEVTVPRAVAPGVEKTQQVDPSMIEEDDDEAGETTNELEMPATRDSGGDYAAVSGETESSSARKLPQPEDEDLRLPKRDRGGEQEARALNVLQAFDTTEGTGRFEEMIEPADRGAQPVVEPDGADPRPIPALYAPAARPPRLERTRPASKAPLLLAIVAGVVFGSLAVLLITGGMGDNEPAPVVPAVPAPLPSASPREVNSAQVDAGGPKVTPLATTAAAPPKAAPVVAAAGTDMGVDASATQAPPDASAPGRPALPVARRTQKEVMPKRTTGAQRTKSKKKEAITDRVSAGGDASGKRARRAEAAKTSSKTKKVDPAPKEDPAKKGGGCPKGMARVRPRGGGDGYCIDRFEAPGRGRKPMIAGLSAARAACRARGARLCTTREWMRSCGGLFPYGRKFEQGRCNTGSTGTVAAGSKKSCRSPHGVYDLSGNVAEWVEEGVAMGGHYGVSQGHASCTARTRGGVGTGYRCCADPEWDL